jgi:hypothetical protein
MIGLKLQPKPEVSKMRSFFISTAAIVLLCLSPLLAADKATLVGLPHPISVPDALPDTVNEGFIATSVLLGVTDPERLVPCFNCVNGPDIQTLLVALPLGAVFSGSAVTIVITGDDLFYGGDATFTFNIKANPTVAPVLTGIVGGTVSPGIYFAQFPITAPAPGAYILEGVISTGENLSKQTTVSTHIIIGEPQL